MKITGMTPVVNIYRKTMQQARSTAEIPSQQKDMLEVSADAQSFAEVLQAVKSELQQPTSAERLDSIKERMQAGTYGREEKNVAASILVDIEL